MSELGPGTYNIVSLTEGNPTTSITAWISSPHAGTGPDFQHVTLEKDVQVWLLTKQDGDQIFQLRIGKYPWTGVREEKVITTDIGAHLDLKWHVTYQQVHDAYTIEPNEDRSKGWTITKDAYSDDRVIGIAPIAGVPEELLPTQLFRFRVAQP